MRGLCPPAFLDGHCATKIYKANPTSCFPNRELPYLWMAVFGMVVPDAERFQNQTAIFG